MLYEPLLAHQMAKEQMKDNLREAERTRLIRVAEDSRKSRRWRLARSAKLQGSVGSLRTTVKLVNRFD